jgi:hypothetical protein
MLMTASRISVSSEWDAGPENSPDSASGTDVAGGDASSPVAGDGGGETSRGGTGPGGAAQADVAPSVLARARIRIADRGERPTAWGMTLSP